MSVVSAIVCTRNRAIPVVRAVRSLLDEASADLEVIVMDQSDGAETEHALSELVEDVRLRYHRSKTRGKGAALNEGLALAQGDIVVCTDDDCEVPPGWVLAMAALLDAQPTAAIAFCNVNPVPHDPSLGYVPAYQRTESRLLRSVTELRNGLALGAAMALRRDFARSIGGFDESFGPGARFPSADEWDLCIRALVSGRHVYESADLSILHDGFRTLEEGKVHARRDWVALGAVAAKPIKAGHLQAAIIPLWFFPVRALWPPVSDLLHLKRPRGLARIAAFVRGFADGFRTPVEHDTLRFSRLPQDR